MYRFLAECTVFFHFGTFLAATFGWVSPLFFWFWGAALCTTFLSWILVDGCVVAELETYFRKKADMEVRYGNSFLGYWGEKIFGSQNPSDQFIKLWGYIFLVVSLLCWGSYFFHDWLAVYTTFNG